MKSQGGFNEVYKTISDMELLHILENPGDYQPSAVEAAERELDARQLTEAEVKAVKDALVAARAKEERRRERVVVSKERAKHTFKAILEMINPVQTGVLTTEKTFRFVVVLFSGLSLYQVIRACQMLEAYAREFPRSPVTSSLVLLPVIVLPIATIAFWTKRKIGWTLLAIFLTFTIANVLCSLYLSFSWKSSEVPKVDRLFPRPATTTFIIQLLFFLGALLVLCKKDLRAIFLLSSSEAKTTIAITAAVSFALNVAIS
jgi:hypothetical protein